MGSKEYLYDGTKTLVNSKLIRGGLNKILIIENLQIWLLVYD